MKKKICFSVLLVVSIFLSGLAYANTPAVGANDEGQITNDHLTQVWARKYDYANDEAQSAVLQNAMIGLSEVDTSDPESDYKVDVYLEDIARVTGEDLDSVRSDWETYQEIQKKTDSDELTDSTDYQWASEQQLQGGSVIAENIDGMDSPVFGAMLQPTLGTTGPGGGKASLLLDKTAGQSQGVADHTTVHDAYGWLYNNLDIGPGYAYAPNAYSHEIAKTASPLSGQVSGLENALQHSSSAFDKALYGKYSSVKFAGMKIGNWTFNKGKWVGGKIKEKTTEFVSWVNPWSGTDDSDSEESSDGETGRSPELGILSFIQQARNQNTSGN